MDREEHLAWCKRRALEYADAGDAGKAVASMLSDLARHPGTRAGACLGMLGLMPAAARDAIAARQWIEGFR